MKKLIASTLALTMLVTPLVGSACFADTAQKPNIQCVQNENRSEPFKEKKYDPKRTRKTLAGVAAVTVAIAGTTVATLKHFEDKLPESLKAKLPSLFTKKTQENTESEKSSETVTETETAKDENTEPLAAESEVSKNQTVETVTADSNITKNETIETLTVDSNITKNETIEPITTEPSISMNKTIETVATESNITKNETTIETIAAEPNITKKENTGSVAVNSNTTKNETADIEAIKAKIIQSLAKNNTTNNTNDTNWLSTMKITLENTGNSAKEPSPLELAIAKYIVGGLVVAAGSTLLFFAGHRVQRAFANLFNKPATNAAKRTAKNAVVRRTAKRITY